MPRSRTATSARAQFYARANEEGFPGAAVVDQLWPDEMTVVQMSALRAEVAPDGTIDKLAKMRKANSLILAGKDLVERPSGVVVPTQQPLWTPLHGFTLLGTFTFASVFENGVALLKALDDKGRKVGGDARGVLSKADFPMLCEAQEWDLYKGTFGALGCEQYPCKWDAAYFRSAQLGFDRMPRAAAAYLRLGYEEHGDQFTGYLLTELSPDPDHHPHAFYLKRNAGGFWLFSRWVDPEDRFSREVGVVVGRRNFLHFSPPSYFPDGG